MTRVYLFVILMFHCALSSVQNESCGPSRPSQTANFSLRRATWLMQGDVLTQEEASARHIRLITWESHLSVNTRMDAHYARSGYFISCVIAASIHGNGHVSVAAGGYGSKEVRILYVTKNDEPDVLYVFVQAVRREPVSVAGNVAANARLGIVYEPIKNWTQSEVQDALGSSNTSLVANS
nr:PREDICTED: uncharacterized protein LOC105673095 isoform X1 [Linepithema humile]